MKTIRGKIFLILLVISLFSMVLMGVVTFISVNMIRTDVFEASSNLGTTAGDSSGRAVEEQILERLSSTAETKASIADEKLGKQQVYTQILADYAGDLYASPEDYSVKKVSAPDPLLAGTNTTQLLLAEGVSALELEDEIGLVANCKDILLHITEVDEDITADYIATESGFVIMVDPDSDKKPETIDGRQRGWYIDAKNEGSLIWTDVFSDAMGRGLAITCAAPVFDSLGEVRAVVGIGALMTNLNEEIISTSIGETGYAFVVNQEGSVIISPYIQRDEHGEIKTTDMTKHENPEIAKMMEEMLDGTSSVAQVKYEGRQVYMACQPMSVLPWGVVTVMDVEEALRPVSEVNESIMDMTDAAILAVDNSVKTALIAIVAVVCLVLIMVFILSYFFSKKLTGPLAHLSRGVEEISGGNLDTKLEIKTGDEIETLALAFNSMTGSLQQHIKELTAVTAEKERIGAELNVATQIQASMLPCIFPPFPEHKELDIFASMRPAKEVGGDFYDFFLVDEENLGIIIADVSGKGVPAALFMVIAKTLIKNHTQNGEAPSQVLTAVNTQLCENNDAAMFVTAWMGVLNIKTGKMVYGNAGHNPPLLKRSDGSFTYLKSDPGFVLAGLENISYGEFQLDLSGGDILYLYTDGVTEATNISDELFGEERLKDALDENADKDMKGLLYAVEQAMEAFVGEAEQFDDITMLGIKFKGRENA